MLVEAGRERLGAVAVLAVARHGNEQGRAHGVHGADPACQFVAVHVGQADVEDAHARRRGGKGVQRGLGAVHHGDRVAIGFEQHAQHVGRVGIVVHHQHAVRRHHAIALECAPLADGRLRPCQRQAHREAAALADARAAASDVAAVQLDEAAHQRQAQPQAALRAVRGALGLGKQVKHAGLQLRFDADAVILHMHGHLPILQLHGDLELATVRGVFGRVIEQVGQHLHQPVFVADHLRQSGREHDIEPVPARLDQRARLFDGMGDHGIHVLRHAVQRDLAARDARDIEQVVHQARHVAHLAPDHGAGAAHAVAIEAGQLHQFGRSADGGERIAQFVRQHGEKFILAPVRVLQRFLRAGAFDGRPGPFGHAARDAQLARAPLAWLGAVQGQDHGQLASAE